jgi:hypothetical protein
MSAIVETEAQFAAAVLEAAKALGWRTAHFRAARTAHGWRTPVQGDGKGFPDLVLLRDDRLVVAELKAKGGQARPEQEDWLLAFEHAGVEAYLWAPDDWEDITAVLRGWQ